MGQMMLVTLREGIEMFLIVAIAAAYVRKTGRAALLPAVRWGTATAIAASVAIGTLLAEKAVTPLSEGVLSLIAAALVISVDARALPVLLVPTVTVFAVYRAYVAERQRHEKLEFLYEANRTLSNSPEVAEANRIALPVSKASACEKR